MEADIVRRADFYYVGAFDDEIQRYNKTNLDLAIINDILSQAALYGGQSVSRRRVPRVVSRAVKRKCQMKRILVLGLACSLLSEIANSQGQHGLPPPGTYSGSSCPQLIGGCKAGESAVIEERWVDHGDYVNDSDPSCNRNVSAELQKSGRALADSQVPGASTYAGPLIDEGTKQLAGILAGAQQGGALGALITSMTGSHANCQVLCAVLPANAQIKQTVFFAGDGDRGAGLCDKDGTGQSPCYNGYSKFVPLEPVVGSQRVLACNEYRNWSHDRARWASMAVKYTVSASVANQGFSPQCLNGTWREQYDNPLSWNFAVAGTTVTIRRTDNFVSGTFNQSGNDWVGQLHWGNGDTWNNVVLTPNSNCNEVRTNQSWWYRR
jgi:hypothetical protein